MAEAGLRLRQLFGLEVPGQGVAWLGESGGFPWSEEADVHPESRLYAQELADLYRMTGQYELMLEEYLTVLGLDPDKKDEVYARLQAVMASAGSGTETAGGLPVPGGEAYAGRGKDSGKIAARLERLLYQKAQQAPMDGTVQDMLVWILLQQRDFEMALLQAKAYSRRFGDGGQKWLETMQVMASNRHYGP